MSRSAGRFTTEKSSIFSLISERLSPRLVLLAMMTLQLLWLAAIWVTKAATADYKLLPLMLYTVLVGGLFAFLPEGQVAAIHRHLANLYKNEKRFLAVLLVILLVGGAYFASHQRLWPFDEEASHEAAMTVAERGISGLLTSYDQWDWLANQHPPLAPIVYGQILRLLGPQLLVARIVTLLFSAGTGWLIYLIGEALYAKKVGLVAAAFFFTFPLVIRLSATAMVEPMLTFFFTLVLLLTLKFVSQNRWPYLIAVGLVIGLGMLTKYTMILVVPVALAFILVRGSRKQAGQVLGITAVVGLVLGVVWLFVANQINILQTQVETISHYAALVMTNEYGRDLLFETVSNRLPSAIGVYNLPLICLGAVLLLERRRPSDWLLLVWLAGVGLPLFLTLPDHRYFMSAFPALALLMAAAFARYAKPLDRVLLLSICYSVGAAYLFVDWSRAAQLFIS